MKNFDLGFCNENVKVIAGIDEAGRGPLSGPVVAAAVVFKNDVVIDGINDSKKLNEAKREKLYPEIINNCESFGVGIVDNNEIDRINIFQATMLAMKQAVLKLECKPDLLLIDGNKTFVSNITSKAIVKGDAKSFSIAAASIIAKVTRDRMMLEAAEKYPEYLWQKNKGYATKEHIALIRKHGPTPLHRISFLSRILDESQQQGLF